jgi:hypothetical protein
MAEQMRPADKNNAQDPSHAYERSHPQRESGMGRLDADQSTPASRPDQSEGAVKNRQPSRQLNADDVSDSRADGRSEPQDRAPAPNQPDHSMHEEEPDGWDQAPTDIHDPRQKRHPRTEGKGGTR